MADYLVKSEEKILLCGPDGPTGRVTTISTQEQGIRYAAEGDGANAAKTAAGIWSGLTGGVAGFIIGEPLDAFIGGVVGGAAAGDAAKAKVLTSLPKNLEPEVKSNLIQVRIDNGILGNYRRQPPIRPDIDHSSFEIRTVDGHNILYWIYEGHFYPVMLDLEKPNIAFVALYCEQIRCLLEFSLNANGDVEEWNPQRRERWWWKRE